MTPNGRLIPTDDGHDLVLTRSFAAPVADVWASVSEPDRTARWFGRWEGEPGPGRTIKVQMAFEESAPWMDMRIDACEPPYRLAVSSKDEAGSWFMELRLAESGGRTELSLIQHGVDLKQLGEVGPGWEYYLDLLVAAREGTPQKGFDDYYPALKPYYEALASPE